MNVEIITIGDELLIGQVVDTNSAWMGEELNKYGFSVNRITTISDKAKDLTEALVDSISRSTIVLITGGLGPTKDDRTKDTLADYFQVPLVKDEESYKNLSRLFSERNLVLNELTEKQAWVPENCTPLINHVGTAPIMYFKYKGSIIIAMPGVPFEMKNAMKTQVLPLLCEQFKLIPIRHLTIWVANIVESVLSMKLESFELSLPTEASLAYLPAAGIVRLRVSVKTNDEHLSHKIIEESKSYLVKLFEGNIVGIDLNPSQFLGNILKARNWNIGTAESCTGGALAHEITKYAGCSEYYKGSVVAYNNEIKHKLLDVSLSDLETYGAVSKQVVESMARGIQNNLGCEVALATSGIAGPDGGTPNKPIGTIWIAVATPNECKSKCLHLGSERTLNVTRTCWQVWNLLQEML